MPIPKKKKPLKIGKEMYDYPTDEAVLASKWLIDIYVALGRPPDPFTKTGEKLTNIIIAVWEDLYPIDSKIWHEERKEYQKNEMSISSQVSKHTGRSLASFPYPIYKMMKVVFPHFKIAERKNCIKMVKKWPMFRMANKI